MINPKRLGGLMGVGMGHHLEYLNERYGPHRIQPISLVCMAQEDGRSFVLQGHGEAIVLTEDGWFLEDTSGG